MGNAATTFVGQNVGAKKIDRAKKGARTALLLAFAVTFVCVVTIWTLAPRMVAMFNRDSEVIHYGSMFLRCNVPFMMLCCINQVLAGALRGIGDAKTPMTYLLLCQVVLRQIYLFFITKIFPGNIIVVCLGFPLGWSTCAVLMLIHYKRMNWEKKAEERLKK
jgi:Na+-driven multidrug efflux pump